MVTVMNTPQPMGNVPQLNELVHHSAAEIVREQIVSLVNAGQVSDAAAANWLYVNALNSLLSKNSSLSDRAFAAWALGDLKAGAPGNLMLAADTSSDNVNSLAKWAVSAIKPAAATPAAPTPAAGTGGTTTTTTTTTQTVTTTGDPSQKTGT